MTRQKGAVLVFGLFSAYLAWLSAGVSLLDDDWGHLRLAAAGFPGILTTGWEGVAGGGGYYRPVAVCSLYLNFLVSGYSPAVYHITNVLIHCGCCVLVYLLVGRLLPGASRGGAWAALFLFLVLPIHTDTIFWIVGRTDSLCALFYLATLLLFLDYLDRPSGLRLWGFGTCFLLALYAKEMALTLPGVVAMLGLYRQGFQSDILRRALGVCGSLLAIYLVTRWMVLGGLFAGVPDRNFSFYRWGLQLLRAGAMVGMTDYRPFGAILFLLTAGLFGLSRRAPGAFRDLAVLFGLTLASLVPALGRIHRWYLYLPSAFVCMAIARVFVDCRPRQRMLRRGAVPLLGALIAYYGLVLVREGTFWRETSDISEAFIRGLLPHMRGSEGRLFVMNVPSAYTPEGSLGGKPMFAFALTNALAIRSGGEVAPPVVVNHLWLLDRSNFRSRVERLAGGRFRLAAERGGYFSFHGPDAEVVYALDGRTVLKAVLERPWGRIAIESREEIEVDVDLDEGERVVVYDGGRVVEVYP